MNKSKILFAALLVGMSAPTLAETTTYPASNCLPASNNTPYVASNVGSITNYSNNAVVGVTCTIPNVHGNNVLSSVTVYYVDNNPTYNVSCKLGPQGQTLHSSGSSPALQSFTFNSKIVSDGQGMFVSCQLPQKDTSSYPGNTELWKYTVETP